MNPHERRLLDDTEKGWVYVIPVVDDNKHWSIINVTMPNETHDNGLVTVFDKCTLSSLQLSKLRFQQCGMPNYLG